MYHFLTRDQWTTANTVGPGIETLSVWLHYSNDDSRSDLVDLNLFILLKSGTEGPLSPQFDCCDGQNASTGDLGERIFFEVQEDECLFIVC